MYAGRLGRGVGVVSVSQAALAGSPMPQTPGPSDLLLQGLAVQFSEGYRAGTPWLKQALSAFQGEDVLSPKEARWLWLASWVALLMWDDASWTVLSARQLDLVRRSGELSALPFVLDTRSGVYGFMGELAIAKSLRRKRKRLLTRPEWPHSLMVSCRLLLCAVASPSFGAGPNRCRRRKARGEGQAVAMAEFLSGGLYNGLGRYDAALEATTPAEQFYAEGAAIWALTELIEAAVRCGQPSEPACVRRRPRVDSAPPPLIGRLGSRPVWARCSAKATTPSASMKRR